MKPLNPKNRQQYKRDSRNALNQRGLKGVSSNLVVPGSEGKGLLKIGKLLPLPGQVPTYKGSNNRFNKPKISKKDVKTYPYFFVKYENAYIPAGDEVLYSFSVVKPLEPMSLNECSSQLGVKAENITGLSEAQYLNDTFEHPVYINQDKLKIRIRYAELAILPQITPGRLDNVPLGYPDFNFNPSPITTQQGMLPRPPYVDFKTAKGNTGATAINAGGTVGFIDNSVKTPSLIRPTSWSWNFGGTGASPTGSTAQNPVVTFNNTGTYTVTLTASNSAGSSTVSKNNFVTVN